MYVTCDSNQIEVYLSHNGLRGQIFLLCEQAQASCFFHLVLPPPPRVLFFITVHYLCMASYPETQCLKFFFFFAYDSQDWQLGLCSGGWFFSWPHLGSLTQSDHSPHDILIGLESLRLPTFLMTVNWVSLCVIVKDANPGIFTYQSQGKKKKLHSTQAQDSAIVLCTPFYLPKKIKGAEKETLPFDKINGRDTLQRAFMYRWMNLWLL